MGNGFSKNEKEIFVNDITGKEIKRRANLIKKFKYTKSKFKCKVKIAPGTYIYTEDF